MKICVTGSSGHLGHVLVEELVSLGHKVVGVDILPSPQTNLVGSIENRPFVKECIKGCNAVIHSATLHKPHVATHTMQQFVDTNITGTLNLLEESVKQGIESFIFTSTTSTFGHNLSPKKNRAVWVTEDLKPIPKNIYGVTKVAAEDLCQLFYQNHQLPCLILKVSRFFIERDDQKETMPDYTDKNIKAIEYLYRRVDIEDIVIAHILALEQASQIGFNKFIISATTPFVEQDCEQLFANAPQVVEQYHPDYSELFSTKNWTMFPSLGRVYCNRHAREVLGWKPKYDFGYILDCLRKKEDFYSPLTQLVGDKGYHRSV